MSSSDSDSSSAQKHATAHNGASRKVFDSYKYRISAQGNYNRSRPLIRNLEKKKRSSSSTEFVLHLSDSSGSSEQRPTTSSICLQDCTSRPNWRPTTSILRLPARPATPDQDSSSSSSSESESESDSGNSSDSSGNDTSNSRDNDNDVYPDDYNDTGQVICNPTDTSDNTGDGNEYDNASHVGDNITENSVANGDESDSDDASCASYSSTETVIPTDADATTYDADSDSTVYDFCDASDSDNVSEDNDFGSNISNDVPNYILPSTPTSETEISSVTSSPNLLQSNAATLRRVQYGARDNNNYIDENSNRRSDEDSDEDSNNDYDTDSDDEYGYFGF